MSSGPAVLAPRPHLAVAALLLLGACRQTDSPVIAAGISLSVRADSVWVGDTTRVAAVATSADGTALDRPVAWRSSDGRIAAVGTDGLVSALAKGRVWLVASVDDLRDSVEIRALAPVAALRIVPPQAVISVDRLLALRVVLLDADGDTIQGRPITWTSSQPATLAVANERYGEVRALAQGTARMAAQAEGVRDSVTLTILPRVVSVSLSWDADTVALGDTVELTAVPRDGLGHALVGLPIAFHIEGDTVPFTVPDGHHAVARAVGQANVRVEVDSMLGGYGTVWAGVRFSAFSVGHLFSCGPDASRPGVFCLGNNAWGTAGNGSTESYAYVPVQVTGAAVVSVSKITLDHVCGLTATGRYACWGDNLYGQLGVPASAVGTCVTSNGTHACSRVAVGDPALPALTSIAAGYDHSCAVTASGQAWCWGRNRQGTLGRGPAADSVYGPAPVAGGAVAFGDIGAGWGFTCAIEASGVAYCWGGGGVLGTGDSTPRSSPTAVAGDLRFVTLSVGLRHACGLTAAGAAWCWGETAAGSRTSPELVALAPAFVAISAGVWKTCALTSAGEMYCWGSNYAVTPSRAGGDRLFDTVSVGWNDVCGRDRPTGRVFCWISESDAPRAVAGQR